MGHFRVPRGLNKQPPSMGNAPLTVEQQDNVRSGRAIYVDGYHEFPQGAVAKTIWAHPEKWGLPKGDSFWEDTVAIDVPNVAVTNMMEQLGATLLYDEFMAMVYDALQHSPSAWRWRSEVLALRKEFVSRFYGMGIDVWICSEHNCNTSCDEFWILFVDRCAAPITSRSPSNGPTCCGAGRRHTTKRCSRRAGTPR